VSRIKSLEENIAKLEAKVARLERQKLSPTRTRPLRDIQIPGRGEASVQTLYQKPITSYPELPRDWWNNSILPLEVARML